MQLTMPQFPSTSWVVEKSTAVVIMVRASASENPMDMMKSRVCS